MTRAHPETAGVRRQLAWRSLRLGAELAQHALRQRSSWIGATALLVVAALAALLEARSHTTLSGAVSGQRAADLALSGAAFGLLLPGASCALFARLSGGASLVAQAELVARHGAHRRWALLGLTITGAVTLIMLAAALGLVTLALTRGVRDPGFFADALVTSRIAVLAGIVYACYFALASVLGRRGQGRWWALLVDWTLGSGVGGFALPWPRGHLRNLLGAEPVLHLSQPAAAACLLGLSLFLAVILFWRSPA